jgi:hypothetical protein
MEISSCDFSADACDPTGSSVIHVKSASVSNCEPGLLVFTKHMCNIFCSRVGSPFGTLFSRVSMIISLQTSSDMKTNFNRKFSRKHSPRET